MKSNRRYVLQMQHGAALMVALIILMMVSVIGVASLKQSVVQSRIAANSNVSGIAFQAADSAVENVLIDVAQRVPPAGGVIKSLATMSVVRRCVGGEASPGVCNTLQGSANVTASSETTFANRPERPVTGSSTNTNVWRFYTVTGTGRVGASALAEISHEQEVARMEVAAGGDIFDGGESVEYGVPE